MKTKLCVAALFLLAAHIACATVFNVDATKYGVQNWGQVGLDGWRFPYAGAPTLAVGAGTYTFSLVNPQLNADAIYTAWTYNTPWITNYLVFDQADGSKYLFGGATSSTGYANATDAFNGTCGASGSLCVSTFTFAVDTTLVFVTPDAGVFDNAGGVSIDVAPQAAGVPEPASLTLCGAGVLGLLAGRKRRNTR
jgi:hypothetical protein